MRLVFTLISVICLGIALTFQTDHEESIGNPVTRSVEVENFSLDQFLSDLRSNVEIYLASLLNLDIGYYLYTRNNTEEKYSLRLNLDSLKHSPFNSKLDTKFLIHGYLTDLSKQSEFHDIKDQLLFVGDYNVIIVDWTKYNQGFYPFACVYAVVVGFDVGGVIQFLMENAGISAQSVHIIGHSLGAHSGGFAGKVIKNIGRISGLDAAGPIFHFLPNGFRLYYTDADFVDAIHTDGAKIFIQGFGRLKPYGHLDFFPNGGSDQPECDIGKNDPLTCDHGRARLLYLQSIHNCTYLSVYCSNYQSFENETCPPNIKAPSKGRIVERMGFHAKPHPSLPPKSRFYLDTEGEPPYCVE